MQTYEFSENVIVEACDVTNTGQMETPAHRVLIRFLEALMVELNAMEKLLLARGSVIDPGHSGSANEGYLRFSCPYPATPSMGFDFEPVRVEGSIRYQAHQLGLEINSPIGGFPLSDFQEPFGEFHTSGQKLQMVFPIENQDGIRGVRSWHSKKRPLFAYP